LRVAAGRHRAADPGGGRRLRRADGGGARGRRPHEEGSLRRHGSAVTLLDFGILAARVLLPILVILTIVPMLGWAERRGAGLIQDRPGPNRVGPFGLLQLPVDAVKFFFKEDIIPTHADKVLYVLAPGLAVFSALTTFAVIPYGATLTVRGREVPLIGADVSIGMLYVFALTSLSVYGIVLAGWASNNKFS